MLLLFNCYLENRYLRQEYSCSLCISIVPRYSDSTMCKPINTGDHSYFHSSLFDLCIDMWRIRQVCTAIKEQTCVSYAKVALVGWSCDLDLLVIKATSPDDFPLSEKYINDLLRIFSHSPSSFRAFALSFTRRFGRTRSWRVALKCLLLLHRLIRSLHENVAFGSHLLSCRSNGFIPLFPCRFQDSSSSNPKAFTSFVRSYARLLDEAIDYLPSNLKHDDLEQTSDNFTDKMKDLGRIIEVLPQVQSLLDRVIDCNPLGSAYQSFLVREAMKQIVRDSFVCYADFRHDSAILLENLFQLPYRSCVSAFGIYKRAAIQAAELDVFFESCKGMGLCGTYEYPKIDHIPRLQVQALESFLNGMWELTDSTSSSSNSSSSFTDDSEKQLVRLETVVSTKWAKFEDEEEPLVKLEPLIDFDFEDDTVDWETLLETSACAPRLLPSDHVFFPASVKYDSRYRDGYDGDDRHKQGWEMQVYNQPKASNPFDYAWTIGLGINCNQVCGSMPNTLWNGI